MRPQAIKDGGSADKVVARIFNLSSIGGFRTSGASTPYCMSKFAVSALSEGAKFGVKSIWYPRDKRHADGL